MTTMRTPAEDAALSAFVDAATSDTVNQPIRVLHHHDAEGWWAECVSDRRR